MAQDGKTYIPTRYLRGWFYNTVNTSSAKKNFQILKNNLLLEHPPISLNNFKPPRHRERTNRPTNQPTKLNQIKPHQLVTSKRPLPIPSPASPLPSPGGLPHKQSTNQPIQERMMDFAALMSKEIAKAKPTTNANADVNTDADDSSSSNTKNKKYIRRAEAEAQREASYRAEQRALEEKRAARAAEKRRREEEDAEEAQAREDRRRRLAEETRRRREEAAEQEERARRKRLGLPELKKADSTNGDDDGDGDGDDNGDEDLPDDELSAALRRLGEPAVLFGETRRARLRRYRRLTTVTTAGPIPTTLRLVDEADMKVSADAIPQDKAGRRYLFRQLASYFTMVLREWEAALAREERGRGQEDTSFASKTAVNAMVSSRANMVPLFRKFESGDLDDDILKPVVEIVQAAQERRYVDANDGYLRLSIGKAAWPIGVTMVGIHERSAREKLHNGERGHVMGDEVTRKYLQSIKRCLTFAQVRWPPEDIRQLMG
ncbi:hypothetical protein F5Y14DRAFT_427833 [Nemania sp. NC0429]|nr:hypothetical protein F5Y14DRAFT_427833 [Nemania sp. NC0429]